MANEPRIDRVLDAALGDKGKYDENGKPIDYAALVEDPSRIDALDLPQDTKDAMNAVAAIKGLRLSLKAVSGIVGACAIEWSSLIPTHEVTNETVIAMVWGQTPPDGTIAASDLIDRLYGVAVAGILTSRSAIQSAQKYKQAADTALRAANLGRRTPEQVTQPSPN